MINEALRDQLTARAQLDQQVRTTIPAGLPWPDHLVARCQAIDADNTQFVKTVLATHGWPGRDMVGTDGAESTWLIVQHTADRDFQKYCLLLLAQAVAARQADPRHLALLTDRVRVRQGRPQLYATQYTVTRNGELEPAPISEPDHVDTRRARAGLEPLTTYDQQIRQLHSPDTGGVPLAEGPRLGDPKR